MRAASPQTARDLDAIIAAASKVSGLGIPKILGDITRHRPTQYRQASMYVAHIDYGITGADIGRAWGRHVSSATRGIRHIRAKLQDGDERIATIVEAIRRELPSREPAPAAPAVVPAGLSILADSIKAVRQSELTRDAIGSGSGVHAGTIQAWLSGKHVPRVDLLEYVLSTVGYRLAIVKTEGAP